MKEKQALMNAIMEQSKKIESLRKNVVKLEASQDSAYSIDVQVFLAVIDRIVKMQIAIKAENKKLIDLYLKLDKHNQRVANNKEARRKAVTMGMYSDNERMIG